MFSSRSRRVLIARVSVGNSVAPELTDGSRILVYRLASDFRGGDIVVYSSERKAFVGDCLFAGSIGRTDLPGGSYEQLLDSLMHKLMPLGDDVVVYSGHGPATTIGQERRTNPFLTGAYTPGRYL